MPHRSPFPRAAAALVLVAGSAAMAQPSNDNCSSALPIAGLTTVAYDNTGATQDGVGNASCNYFGTDQIDADIWYVWTASQSGPVRMFTCNFTSSDTKLAVYDGPSCPEGSGILACNDDSCGVQSVVSWVATAGHQYLIRIGNYPGATPGPGMFQIDTAVLAGPIINPDNGHSYFLLSPSSWTDGEAAAVAMGGHLATVRSSAENEFLRAQVLGFDGMDRRGWIGLNDPTGAGNFVWSSGEPVNYTNWNGGEPNNIGIENWVEMFFSNGEWNNNTNTTPFPEYPLVEIAGGGPTCYANCDHSTAVPFLNVNDFICFQGKFAAGDSYANCDHSTQPPVLNVNDFICFQSKFAAGCSAP